MGIVARNKSIFMEIVKYRQQIIVTLSYMADMDQILAFGFSLVAIFKFSIHNFLKLECC